MKANIDSTLKAAAGFMSSKVKRRLLWIVLIIIAATLEFFYLGLARRTFVFYTVSEGVVIVEDRVLKRAKTREEDITRYAEETLLGPVSPDLLPLFPRETRLKSLLFRDGIVYADFSLDAALPPEGGKGALDNFKTLRGGILRNFSYVKDVCFFIEGRIVYADEFNRGGI